MSKTAVIFVGLVILAVAGWLVYDSSTVSKGEYQSQLNDALGATGTIAQATGPGVAHTQWQAMITRLEAIEPPSDIAALHSQLIAGAKLKQETTSMFGG